MRRCWEFLKGEKAVTATEFALIAPVLFLLIFTIIEGGRVFSAWVVITNEAREGARYAVVRTGSDTLVQDVTAHVVDRVGSVMDASPGRLGVTVQVNQADPSVAVTVDYKVDIITPFVQSMVPNPFPLRAVSVMRAE